MRKFRVLLGTMVQRPRDVRDIVYMCGVAEDTPGRVRQGSSPSK